MTPPIILVNTYQSIKGKPYIDIVSKMFILMGLPFGIIRLKLFSSVHFVIFAMLVIYSTMFTGYYFYYLYNVLTRPILTILIGNHYIQCVFYIIFNLVLTKRLKYFYNELNVFDKETGSRPKTVKESKWNLIAVIVMLIYMITIFVAPHALDSSVSLYLGILPFPLAHIVEVHYYGHLLSLLIPRLRLINYYMDLSLSNYKIIQTPNIEEFGYSKADSTEALCKMEKLMNLYHHIIKTFNYLIEAIKWQLSISIITTFMGILIGSYKVSLSIINQSVSYPFIISYALLAVGMWLPWFSPCMLGDQVHAEVRKLRQLIACRIYENKLDKSGRTVARALLAWTSSRNLSLCLLQVLDIDTSLPFKFIGFLVTYLIILLQFQKIINL